MIKYDGKNLKMNFKKKSKLKKKLDKRILLSKIDFLENSISLNRHKIKLNEVNNFSHSLKKNIKILEEYIKFLGNKNLSLSDNLYLIRKKLDDNIKTLNKLEKLEMKLNNKVYKKLKNEDSKKKSKKKSSLFVKIFSS